jgi:biopolymer transport protein TolR
VDPQTLLVKLRAVLKYNASVPIMVKGDAAVDYGRVVRAMVLAQAAGAPSVGLITVPPERDEP